MSFINKIKNFESILSLLGLFGYSNIAMYAVAFLSAVGLSIWSYIVSNLPYWLVVLILITAVGIVSITIDSILANLSRIKSRTSPEEKARCSELRDKATAMFTTAMYAYDNSIDPTVKLINEMQKNYCIAKDEFKLSANKFINNEAIYRASMDAMNRCDIASVESVRTDLLREAPREARDMYKILIKMLDND